MAQGRVRIGIGGWTYPPWRGVFYPDKLPQAKELEYASRQLGAIEINATFYGRQKPEELGDMGEGGSRRLPVRDQGLALLRHPLALAEGAEGIGNFFAQGFAALGPKLGPILWQFAPAASVRSRRHRRLHRPASGKARRHRAAPRDRAAPRKLRDEQFFELCRARNIAVVFEDSRRITRASKPTPPTSLMRGCSG